jgi:hypothetical protein
MNQINSHLTPYRKLLLTIKKPLNNYWFLGIFIFSIFASISLLEPLNPVKDERFMIYEINQFSKLGFWGHINHMKNYQGPLYYYFMGLMVSFFKINLLGLRIINCIFSTILIIVVLKIFELKEINKFNVFLVLLNPYFLLLTAPLIYNDNLPLMCLFIGILYYLQEKHFIAICCFSFACLMRQNLIFAPVAILFIEILSSLKNIKWHQVIYITPIIVLLSLFYIWGGRFSSPGLYKNFAFLASINGFNFDVHEIMKAINYQLILLSIFALPLTIYNINRGRKLLVLFSISLIILLVFPPTHINFKFHQYLSFYDYGGLLDQCISSCLYFTIPISAIIISLFLNQFNTTKINNKSKFQLIIIVFILLNLVFYSITPFWDKYYVMMGVFVPLLLKENNNLVEIQTSN